MSVRDKVETCERVLGLNAPANESGKLHKLAARLSYRCRSGTDYWDFIWVVYSVFFFIQPFARNTHQCWMTFAGFYALFLALYAGVILSRYRWQNYLCLVLIGILGALYYPQNNGASGCFIYVAAFLPFISESLLVCLSGFAIVSLTLMTEGILLHTSPWAWGMGALFTLIVGGTNLFTAPESPRQFQIEARS